MTVVFKPRDNSFAVTKSNSFYILISYYIGKKIFVFETLISASPKISNENDN
jgi:hypothetical protein